MSSWTEAEERRERTRVALMQARGRRQAAVQAIMDTDAEHRRRAKAEATHSAVQAVQAATNSRKAT